MLACYVSFFENTSGFTENVGDFGGIFCLNWFKTIDEAYFCIADLKKKNVYNGEIDLSFEYLARGSLFLL